MKATRREATRRKARYSPRGNRKFLFTLDRLAAERDARKIARRKP